jgi:hypothetical protein
MEKSLGQLKKSSESEHKKAKAMIKRRTDENEELIEQLTAFRKRQKDREENLNKLDMEIEGTMLKIRRYEGELDKTQQTMKIIKRGNSVGAVRQGSEYFKEKNTIDSDWEKTNKRAVSRGKLQKGSMYRNRPLGVYKIKIKELVDQLEENNQTILLQRLQITSLREEMFTAANNAQQLQMQAEHEMDG